MSIKDRIRRDYPHAIENPEARDRDRLRVEIRRGWMPGAKQLIQRAGAGYIAGPGNPTPNPST